MDNFTLCLTVVITGLVVVFAVLVLLIFIIKIYSMAVSKGLQAAEKRKKAKLAAVEEAKPSEVQAEPEATAEPHTAVSASDDELIAVIAAAVDAVYGEGTVAVKSIKKAKTPSSRPTWSMAGIYENTRPF